MITQWAQSAIAKTMTPLLDELGVGKSHSRPQTANDNPFSEAQFKTMNYRPDYPERFGSIEDARVWVRSFIDWYNHAHRHTGLALMAPATVHYGWADQVTEKRQQVLQAAYDHHPERFVNGVPIPPQLPQALCINPPQNADDGPTTETATHTEAIPAITGDPPGAQTGSRVGGCLPTCAALDPGVHRATFACGWDCRNDPAALP
jgi:hypothetical protein